METFEVAVDLRRVAQYYVRRHSFSAAPFIGLKTAMRSLSFREKYMGLSENVGLIFPMK